MKYADLNDEQKQSLANATMLIRPLAGEFARLVQKLKLASAGLGDAYTRQLVDSLDAGELIPNSTGLAGATSLYKERLQLLFGLSDAAVALLTTEALAACVDAAGPTNCGG